MPKRILFLDIDGVVNTLMIYKEPVDESDRGKISRDGYYFDLCSPSDKRVSNKQAVYWLDKTCKDTGAQIVLSSTWRRGHYKETIEALYNSGLSRDVKIIGKTPILDYLQRGDEIQKWINDNNYDGQFVIVDDDSDMSNLIDKLVKCNVNFGFGWEQYYEIVNRFESGDMNG